MRYFIYLLALLLLAPGCASKKPQKVETTGPATLVGMIEMVNPEQNYVLIRCEQLPAIQPGTELIALSAEGKKSKLVLSPERKGHYLTADIKEGMPAVTNLVLLANGSLPTPAPAVPAPVTFPTSPGRSPAMIMPTLPDIPLSLLDPSLLKATPPPAAKVEQPAVENFGGLEPAVNEVSKP